MRAIATLRWQELAAPTYSPYVMQCHAPDLHTKQHATYVLCSASVLHSIAMPCMTGSDKV